MPRLPTPRAEGPGDQPWQGNARANLIAPNTPVLRWVTDLALLTPDRHVRRAMGTIMAPLFVSWQMRCDGVGYEICRSCRILFLSLLNEQDGVRCLLRLIEVFVRNSGLYPES